MIWYKGFEIEEVRKQGDKSMFSRVVGYKAVRTGKACAEFNTRTFREAKAKIKEFNDQKMKEKHQN